MNMSELGSLQMGMNTSDLCTCQVGVNMSELGSLQMGMNTTELCTCQAGMNMSELGSLHMGMNTSELHRCQVGINMSELGSLQMGMNISELYMLGRYEHVGVMQLVTKHDNLGVLLVDCVNFGVTYLADSMNISEETSASTRLMIYKTCFYFSYQTARCHIPGARKLSTNNSDNCIRWEDICPQE